MRPFAPFVAEYKSNTRCIRRPLIERNGQQFENAWPLLWTE
jgi:hypothetical protein